jgi:hypothetical protein
MQKLKQPQMRAVLRILQLAKILGETKAKKCLQTGNQEEEIN